jgi:hypothetical protein
MIFENQEVEVVAEIRTWAGETVIVFHAKTNDAVCDLVREKKLKLILEPALIGGKFLALRKLVAGEPSSGGWVNIKFKTLSSEEVSFSE